MRETRPFKPLIATWLGVLLLLAQPLGHAETETL